MNSLEERLERIEQKLTAVLNSQKRWLTVREFALTVDRHPKWVSELCRTNKIRCVRSEQKHGPNQTYRIPVDEIERFQNEGGLN